MEHSINWKVEKSTTSILCDLFGANFSVLYEFCNMHWARKGHHWWNSGLENILRPIRETLVRERYSGVLRLIECHLNTFSYQI